MPKRKSRLTQKISRRFLFLYTLIFSLLAVIILSVSWLIMVRNVRNDLSSRVTTIMDSWNTYYSLVQEKRYAILGSNELTTLLESYLQNPSEQKQQSINLLLANLQTSDSSLNYILLEEEDGALFHSLNHSDEPMITEIQNTDEYVTLWNTNSSYLSPVMTEGFENISSPYCYYVTEQTVLGRHFLLTIFYNAKIFTQNFDDTAEELSNAHLLSASGIPLYSKERESSDSIFETLLNTQGMTGTLWADPGYAYFVQSSRSTMLAVGYYSYWNIFRSFVLMFLVLLAAYLIPMSIALFYLERVNDQYLQPLGSLSRAVEQYQLDGDPIMIYHTEDEIEDLSKALHTMSLNIAEQSAKISQNERQQAISEYQLITTQMDPHFIYNTMNIINILARRGKFADIIEVNTALTRMIREQLNTRQIVWEKVETELEFLRQYQRIMNYRYRNQVEVEIDVDPSVSHCYLPKNILQPLMENSYYHGLSKDFEEMKGLISLYIYPVEKELVLELSDDGKGFSPERLAEVKKHFLHPDKKSEMQNHIGMANIYRRLFKLYGTNFTMDIQSEENEGTMIAITIPLLWTIPENDLNL